ncbi:MAG: hypothetical protein HeimC2_40340 [Candidatus Heimdallarchaeota archaeon LC_2]|nr:MAG: hypothetical protein HeimC2_40340 [Candidatus Heimdallarchaeota archaeon LC_2]
MSIRKSLSFKRSKSKNNPSKTSRVVRKGWDEGMNATKMRKILRKLDALADWEQPEDLNESLTADIISAIPFIGLRRAIAQFKKEKTATNVFDGVGEFISVAGSTVAMILPSNTVLYVKREYLPQKYQKKIKHV